MVLSVNINARRHGLWLRYKFETDTIFLIRPTGNYSRHLNQAFIINRQMAGFFLNKNTCAITVKCSINPFRKRNYIRRSPCLLRKQAFWRCPYYCRTNRLRHPRFLQPPPGWAHRHQSHRLGAAKQQHLLRLVVG